GWLCVRHHRQDRWPVIEEENDEQTPHLERRPNSQCFTEVDNISLSNQFPSLVDQDISFYPNQRISIGENDNRGSNPRGFYIPCDDEDEAGGAGCDADSGDDEGLHIENTVTAYLKWNTESGSGKKVSIQKQAKSQTLPHQRTRPHAGMISRHIRSHSECKQSNENYASLFQTDSWLLSTSRTRKDSTKGDNETKSRSNSCTDSSGVSSCDSGVGVGTKMYGPHEQTLSPIPSSTSLNTLKPSSVSQQMKDNTVIYRKLPSISGSITSEGPTSPESLGCRLSQQDVTGYATLRSLNQYRRPLFSDSISLAAMELLVFNDHGPASHSISQALKVRSLDRQFIYPGMCEFEASLPPQLPSGASSFSLAGRTYIGSRSNLAAVKNSGELDLIVKI
ncbi:hypothetical protein C0J52_07680, partial [Blattella germanica]